jgi:tryptophan synthase alpha subunit
MLCGFFIAVGVSEGVGFGVGDEETVGEALAESDGVGVAAAVTLIIRDVEIT